MAAVTIWTTAMSVGNDEIDLQHQKLMDTANIVRSLSGREDREIILAALDDVVGYTLKHFAFEETLLLKSNYKGFDQHKAQHDTIRECVHTVAKNRDLVTIEMLDDVMTRLINHIITVDKDYAGAV